MNDAPVSPGTIQMGRRAMGTLVRVTPMDTVPHQRWTTESFLAWEDRQEYKHEFDGRNVLPMTGGSVAHQEIVFNLLVVLRRLLVARPVRALHEVRLRVGDWVRYPDVAVSVGPLELTTRTLTDALAVFEVLSEDTAVTDRVKKLANYADVPSLHCYVLLDQTDIAATLFARDPEGSWIASGHTDGKLVVPGLDVAPPLVEIYQGLAFPEPGAVD